MALMTFSDSDILFDPDFMTEAELGDILTKLTPDLANTGEGESPSPFLLKPVATYEEAREQVRHLMEKEGMLADIMADVQAQDTAISVDDVLAQMDADLKPALESGELSPGVKQMLADWEGYATYTEEGGTGTLMLGGETVLRIGPFAGSRNKNAKVVAATIVVVIDIIFVIMAISSVKAARTRQAEEAMGNVVKKGIKPMTVLVKGLLGGLSKAMAEFRDKDKPKKNVVVEMINEIAKAIGHALERMWKHMWGDLKRLVKALLSSLKQIVYAIASITATVLLALGTAGAALVASLLSLALTLVSLVDDSIKLKQAMDGA